MGVRRLRESLWGPGVSRDNCGSGVSCLDGMQGGRGAHCWVVGMLATLGTNVHLTSAAEIIACPVGGQVLTLRWGLAPSVSRSALATPARATVLCPWHLPVNGG